MAAASSSYTPVLLDPQIFFLQSNGGITRYFTCLNAHLYCPITSFHPPSYVSNWHIAFRLLAYYVLSIVYILSNFKFLLSKPIIHSTYYLPSLLHLFSSHRVSTIHDLIPESGPRKTLFSLRMLSALKRRHIKSFHLIFVSRSTEASCRLLYPSIYPSIYKSTIIYHGCDFSMPSSEADDFLFDSAFLLYVGNRSRHKNFTFLVDALGKYPELTRDFKLVLVGGGSLTPQEEIALAHVNIDYVVQPNLSDRLLFETYARADALVYVSTLEGFGLPILEAFRARCPVICLNQSSMSEISAGYAVYTINNDHLSLRNAIYTASSMKSNVQSINDAYNYSLQYTWQRSADSHLSFYRDISRI